MMREFLHAGEVVRFDLVQNDLGVLITLDGQKIQYELNELSAGRLVIKSANGQLQARVARSKDRIWVWVAGRILEFGIPSADGEGGGHGALSKDDMRAPMPGTLRKLLVKPGDLVEAGQVVAVVEAMKMEHQIRALRAGTVARTDGVEGAIVDADAVIVALEREE